MKNIIFGIAIAATTLAACNSGNNRSTETQSISKDSTAVKQQTGDKIETTPAVAETKSAVSINEIVTTYLQIKNAFTVDNSTGAAAAGTSLENAFKTFDKNALSADQKKIFEDVEEDAREHAEHIVKNGGNIAHQREHFEILSKDVYDLVKIFGGGQALYKDFCPMYNDNKGAFWLSETKEIKNPYLGKAMPTCGTIQEELK